MESKTSNITFFSLKLNQLEAQLAEIDKGPGVGHSSRSLPLGKTWELQEAVGGLALNDPLWCGPAWLAPHRQSSFPLGGLCVLIPAQHPVRGRSGFSARSAYFDLPLEMGQEIENTEVILTLLWSRDSPDLENCKLTSCVREVRHRSVRCCSK